MRLGAVLVVLALLGSGAAPVNATTAPAPLQPQADEPTSVALDADPLEPLTDGGHWEYTRRNAFIRVARYERGITARVHGDQGWNGSFHLPKGQRRFRVGRYSGGVTWAPDGSICDRRGWFEITDIAYRYGELTRLKLRFEQRCDGHMAALRGAVSWTSSKSAPWPQNPRPEPATTWRPPPAVIPDRGNVFFIQGDPNHPVTGGKVLLYRGKSFYVDGGEGDVDVGTYDDDHWNVEIEAPRITSRISRGFYGDLQKVTFGNPVKGGLYFGGGAVTCTGPSWAAIDRLKKKAGKLRGLTMRFEQRCAGASFVRGYVRWDASTRAPRQPFADIVGHPNELAMTRLARRGWMRGFNDGTFRPRRAVTRGEIADIIYRAKDYPAPSDDAPRFSDIANSPYRASIRRIAENNVMKGYRDGTFRPNRRISRGQLAALLNHVFLNPYIHHGYEFFHDSLGTRHDQAIRELIGDFVIRPVGTGRFRPHDPATRAATALMLARATWLVPTLRML